MGSPGVRWLGGSGQVLHRNPEWVKSMDSRGHLENHDWGPVYAALQRSVNGSANGFMWHEAVRVQHYNCTCPGAARVPARRRAAFAPLTTPAPRHAAAPGSVCVCTLLTAASVYLVVCVCVCVRVVYGGGVLHPLYNRCTGTR